MKQIIKIFAAIAAALVSMTLNAENADRTLEFNRLDSFNAIKVSSVYKVELVKSKTCKVTVEVDGRFEDCVDVKVKNHILYLSLKDYPKSLRNVGMKKLNATVHIPELVSVELSGASKLSCSDAFRVNTFLLSVSGASMVSGLKIEADKADIELSGASKCDAVLTAKSADLELSGSAHAVIKYNGSDLDIDASGASDIQISGRTGNLSIDGSGAIAVNAFDLQANDVDVDLSGASKVQISAENSLKADLTGASTCIYRGGRDLRVYPDISRGSSFRKDR